MRSSKWLFGLMALLACGLIAAGCGDDDDDSGSDSSATTEESSDSGSDSSASSGGSTPEDVLKACEDAIAGTPAEEAGQSGCEAAADAFATCAEEADALDSSAAETAVQACQDTADAAVKALEASP